MSKPGIRLSAFVAALALIGVGGSGHASDDGGDDVCKMAAESMAAIMAELPPAAAGTETVLMYKYVFCPNEITVKPGTTIRFVNVEKRTNHNVWFKEAGRDESERLFPGEYWEEKFDAPGRYPYLCTPHWESHKMIGVVNVAE